jgi:hypothetical protein
VLARGDRPGPGVLAQQLIVTLDIQATGIPNDTYSGVIRTRDGRCQADVRIAVDELGLPE